MTKTKARTNILLKINRLQPRLKIGKDAAVSKPISTGSIIGDYAITKIPYIGQAIKAYNKGSLGGSHIAHGINAYNESCRGRKKK